MSTPRNRQLTRAAALAGITALTLAACGGDDGGTDSDESTEESGDAADEGEESEPADEGDEGEGEGPSGELLVWAWDPTVEPIADAYMEANPGVTIELANVGTGGDHYTALQNAIAAGSGVPDLAQVEYYALPQFYIAGSLADLSGLGADGLEGTYTPGPWSAVSQAGGIYGLPLDSGPMALFYNEAVFDEHGIEVPATWDEYLEAARALQAADPEVFITNDVGDAGFTTSMIWQAGGRPFGVDGTDVTIDFTDEGSARYAELWQQMVDEELVAPTGSWSDEWFTGLGNGTIATLVIGAWMPGNLESGAPDAAGDWRVAPMPQWDEGESVAAENGGSAMSVTEASENKELAYSFLEFASAGDGVPIRIDGGGFPSTTAELESGEFLSHESEYFGGQKINEVLAQSAANVAEGWQYLPFQVYANSVFNDTVGQAYVSDTTIADGLADWQEQSTTYGNDQGFTVGN